MADPSKTAAAVIALLQAVTMSLSPSTVSLAPSGAQQFTGKVFGTSNTGVTWSISPPLGTISSAGLYTAPSSVLTAQGVNVTGRSVADPTKSASAVVSLETPPVVSHTYYISSSSGSDSNDGFSAQRPWKSLDKIYLNYTFLPGDQILLNRGDTWDGQIVVNARGTANNPILLGSYGTGANPILYGDMHAATWTPVSGRPGVYVATAGRGSILYRAYAGTTALTYKNPGSLNLDSPADLNTYLSSFTAGSWGPDTDYGATDSSVWVKTLDGLPPTNITVFRDEEVMVESSSYLTIENLDIRQTGSGIELEGSSYVTVQDNSVQNALIIGINLTPGTVNCLVANNTINNTGNDGLYAIGNYPVTPTNNTFRSNTVSNVTLVILGINTGGDGDGIGLQWQTNTLVEKNSFSHIRGSCFDDTAETNDTMRYNYCYNVGDMAGGTNGTGNQFYYNIIDVNNAGAYGFNAVDTGGGTPTLIYNNVIYGVNYRGGYAFGSQGVGIVIFRNNIAYNTGSGSPVLYLANTNGNSTSDYNLFYMIGSAPFTYQSTNYTSLASYSAATGQDTHSIFANPQFSSADPVADVDFHLQPSSPGVGAGENLLGAGIIGPTQQYLDYDSIVIPSRPNVGAY
jgi:parallel beta-helix repeat protein